MYGNIVKMQHFEGESKHLDFTETTVYTYDSYNNWTKKTIHRISNEGYSYDRIVERFIEYY